MKIFFWKKKQKKQRQSLICLKNCEMNNFLATLELCTFYINHKKVKFMAINCRGRTNVKYFMQTHVFQFCKDTAKVSSRTLLKRTTKSTHFIPAQKKTPILSNEHQTNKYKRSQNLTSKHRAIKICKLQRLFQKMWKRSNLIFQKISYFLLQSSFLSIYLHKSIHKKWTFPLRIYLVNVNISP